MSLLPPPAGVPPSAALSTVASGSNNSSSNSNNNNNNLPFEKDKVWYFSTEQLTTSPSRRCGIKSDDELHYRQMTAYLIQEMGQRLQVSQLCINTAIVYMHRFYAFHSFTHFHRNSMASASLFLAAKVEEQPRKLEHVIRAANKCLPQASEQTYADLAQELVFNENVLLQTLGFDVAIDHPHTHVVRTCQLVKACKDLAQTSYFLASNSLHLTSMCLQYRPTVVACFCIYLACKWSRWEIPQSTEGKHWFYYVDKSVSLDLLKQLTDEFISIYEKSPARLKSKLNSIKAIAQGASNRTAANSKDNKPKEEWKMSEMMKGYHSNITAPPELMNGGDSSRDSSSAQGPLLPPPTMVPSQQRRIGPPGNSSSSTSSSSMNHKLPNYPGALPPEAHGDHKSKQPGYRPPSSLSQRGSSSVGGSSASSGNSQRSSSAHPGIRPPMPMDYHKSSRGMQPPVGMQAHGGHKTSTSSKPQQPPPPLLDGRSSSSSSASNLASAAGVPSKDVNKAISNSKMYPTPPSFSSSGTPIQLMSRGGYQGINSGGSGNGTPLPPSSGYSSHGSSHRSSKSSSGVSSASSSVHSLPSYDQPPPQNYSSVPGYNQHMQQQQQMPPPEATQPQLSKNNSLFSPEWSDIKKEPQFNGLLPPPPPGPGHDSLGFKLNSHTRDRDSPKKGRLTPTKKDKHRTTLPHSSSSNSSSTTSTTSSTILSGNAPKPMLPPPPHKKTHGEMELGNSNLKRANDLSGSQYGHSKLDEHDGSLPRDKVRKLDTGVSLTGYSSYEEKHVPLSMTNGGIETTPDLVRSLLKESLCTTNASLLKPDLKPPIELLEPMPLTPPLQIKKEPVTPTSAMTAPSPIELSAQTKLEVGEGIKELDGVGKSEKKKKKDKHKHKEKDKSKDKPDKEERKKHKKDKQKERSSKDNSMDSLKLVIKTNTATANPNGAAVPLKLKISKNKVEPTGMVAMPTAPAASGFDMAPPTATTTAQPSGAYGGGGAAFSTSNNNSSSSHSTSGKKKHSDRDRDKESKKMQKAQDYAKYNGVGGAYAPLSGAGAATQSLTAPVSNLLGLPANMTTASSTSSNSLATGVSAAGAASGIAPPPAAQPIYNKK